jgi:hypothetical protein
MLRESAPAERWFFYQDNTGLWKWARLDVLGNVLGHSGMSFESRAACMVHARQCGYEDERRPELGLAVPQESPPQDANVRASS